MCGATETRYRRHRNSGAAGGAGRASKRYGSSGAKRRSAGAASPYQQGLEVRSRGIAVKLLRLDLPLGGLDV